MTTLPSARTEPAGEHGPTVLPRPVWYETTGGPFVLLAEEDRDRWPGLDRLVPRPPRNHHVQAVPLAGGTTACLLGCDSLPTTWLSDEGLLVQRLLSASEADPVGVRQAVGEWHVRWHRLGSLRTRRAIVFDSYASGADAGLTTPRILVDAPAGDCALEWCEVGSGSSDAPWSYRLLRLVASGKRSGAW